MKVAIFTDTFFPDVNGVARTLKRFTHHLQERGHQFRIFAPESTNDHLFSNHIYRFTSLPFFLYPECRLALPNMLQVKAELLRFQPDIIHIATPFNVGLCGLHYAKKLNIPLVGSYHTDFDQYLEYYDLQIFAKLLWKYMHWFYRPFRKIFVPSHFTLEQLKRHGFANMSIWSRGVDCKLFHPHYDKLEVRQKYGINEKYILSYVGRIAPEKDIETLLNIINQLPNDIARNVRWLIVGDGPLMTYMKEKASENVTFTGYLNGTELAKIYSTSDIFVFPSPTETFGNVVLEAIASGTPVIGANSGGVKNIIQHGKTGILCEPKNTEQFIDRITDLLTHHSMRIQMGHEARNYSLSQTWEQILDRLIKEYEEVIHDENGVQYA
ncbi:glycosyltransferase family 4 protein [Aeribacillus alveayuensis]|uniref:Glycosyltransferase involved in cell wall biosynthesis n=1 Tax=Aeribacillus alveayuensis TaxID=279215 RepID=A0ABT9VJ13_9BACI|nr:glycosyltransferase involved in cell wall biosynthesis [Bacillus alveayuensis]